jgi:hypothetical protein
LIAGLAMCDPAWREALLSCLDPAIEQRIMETLMERGPAVDGVTLRRTMTIDGLDMAEHRSKLEAIREIAGH